MRRVAVRLFITLDSDAGSPDPWKLGPAARSVRRLIS
jgi:hypothetical protein